ncbi:MAG: ABC transporter ATP-binding protein [Thermaerobacter sp.]|nr:ABC transporter ATP-binding protein [Thermaerobacter sp.]
MNEQGDGRVLLEVDRVRKSYRRRGGGEVSAVCDVSFELKAGRILAFLGPNGAGKTTTIKMIAGLVRMDGGDVRIGGHSIRTAGPAALRQLGAVLEGSRNLYWRLTPIENIEYWAGIRGVPRRRARERGLALLTQCGLEDKAHQTVQQLSRGMQQLVAICASLVHEPRLLLLDEPTLGLDLDAADRIQQIVERLARIENVGILLTTHQMEVAQRLSDEVVLIREGSVILKGATDAVRERLNGDSYAFELGAGLREDQRAYLIGRDATFDSPTTFRLVVRSPEDFYDIVRRLEPCPIIRASRDTADLGTVFRHYVHGEGLEEASS